MPPDPPLILVTWLDAWSDAELAKPDEARGEYPVRTVGFLVRDRTDVLSLAAEILPDGDGYRALTHIPRSLVISLLRLGPVEGIR